MIHFSTIDPELNLNHAHLFINRRTIDKINSIFSCSVILESRPTVGYFFFTKSSVFENFASFHKKLCHCALHSGSLSFRSWIARSRNIAFRFWETRASSDHGHATNFRVSDKYRSLTSPRIVNTHQEQKNQHGVSTRCPVQITTYWFDVFCHVRARTVSPVQLKRRRPLACRVTSTNSSEFGESYKRFILVFLFFSLSRDN